jgi:hypothetical protein
MVILGGGLFLMSEVPLCILLMNLSGGFEIKVCV